MKNKKFLALIMALVMVISMSSVTVFATSDVANKNEETTSVEATTSETSDTTVSDTTDSEEAANNESDENGAEQTTEPSDGTAPADTEKSTDPVEENKEDTPANEEDTQTTGETTPVEEKTEETSKEDADPVFSDVAKDAWYAEAVNYAYEKGYMIGIRDSKFAPDAKMTRAMMAMVLYNVEGKPEVEGTTKFADVASDTWYAKAVLWAEKAGVTNGTSDTTFSPDDIITREQFVTMLYRYAKSPDSDIEVKADSFKDMDGISEWAKNAVIWAIGNKLLVGCDESIMPQGETTRAQAATVLQRYDSEILNPVSEPEDESDTTPADETPSEDAPEDSAPAEETPAEDTPSENTPADENPNNTPSEETHAEGSDNPSEDTPEDGTPSNETPAEDTPSDGESNKNN